MQAHRQTAGLVGRDRSRDRGLVASVRQPAATQGDIEPLAALLLLERLQVPQPLLLPRSALTP